MKLLAINKLNPFTWPLAFVLSFFVKVYFWRAEKLPEKLLSRFQRLEPHKRFTWDQWLQNSGEFYDRWKDVGPKVYSQKVGMSVDDQFVDFTKNWLQHLAIGFDQRSCFGKIIENLEQQEREKVFIAPAIFDRHFEKLGLLKKTARPWWCSLFIGLDWLWVWFKGIGTLSYVVRSCFRPNYRLQAQKIWLGVSPVEMASQSGQLDFTVIAQRTGQISASLFVLPQKPNRDQEKWLYQNKVQWIVRSQLPHLLSLKEKMSVLGKWMVQLPLILSSPSGTQGYRLKSYLEVLVWKKIIKSSGARAFLSTMSACWPEESVTSLAQSQGLRSIVWFYGSNIYRFADQVSEFQDLDISVSVFASSEVWVWSSLAKSQYERRFVLPDSENPKISVVGPIMCGDSDLLEQDPQSLRKENGISKQEGVFLSIFDVPTIDPKTRARMGAGPTPYSHEVLETFYEDLVKLLQSDSKLQLILKPKRSFNDPLREYPKSLETLLDPQGKWVSQGRVHVVDYNSDPYLAIAMSDICIGLPFTSPVQVALLRGRRGYFYDPTGSVKVYPGCPEYAPFLISGQSQLLKTLSPQDEYRQVSTKTWEDLKAPFQQL